MIFCMRYIIVAMQQSSLDEFLHIVSSECPRLPNTLIQHVVWRACVLRLDMALPNPSRRHCKSNLQCWCLVVSDRPDETHPRGRLCCLPIHTRLQTHTHTKWHCHCPGNQGVHDYTCNWDPIQKYICHEINNYILKKALQMQLLFCLERLFPHHDIAS